jgi:6-phospho-beta-glucosidase
MDAWADDMESRGATDLHERQRLGRSGRIFRASQRPGPRERARDVGEVAPGARIFNYTNPAPVEALAMLTVAGAQVTSLCSCTHHPASVGWLARQAGVGPELIEMPPLVAGINHCAGVTELRLRDGTDVRLARIAPWSSSG